MKLAFWKGKSSRRNPARSAGAGGAADFEAPPAEGEADDEARVDQLRVRARRRLIGAAALLLLVVVLVPMLLDPTPRAVPDNIPIELPSDRTPFAPKLVAPPAEAPAPDGAGLPAAPGSAADAPAVAEGPANRSGVGPEAAKTSAKTENKSEARSESRSAARKPEPKVAEAKADAGGRIFVQAAALAKESAARELVDRLGKSGLSSFVERAESSGGTHYRVRLGPFASRDEAERARARLHALGVASNIVIA